MESEKQRYTQKDSPRVTASILSALTFSWTFKTFWKGYKRDLDPSDLFKPLKEHTSNILGDNFEKKWHQEFSVAKQKGKRPSLLRVIFRTFGFQIMLYGIILAIMEIVCRISQPLFLGALLDYFHSQTKVTKAQAYTQALGIITCSAVNVAVIHPFMMATMHIGMKVRLACCSLIYRKSLKLSKTALRQATIGQVVNLLANDVSRFDSSVIFFHYLWIGPLQTIILTYLLWEQIGFSSLVGVAAVISFIPLQAWLGKKTSSIRLKTAMKTDTRVRLMNEIIYGIQVIKMYTWEKPFGNLVSEARRKEINEIRKTAYIRGILSSFNIFHIRIAIFVSMLAYVWTDHTINAQKVFIVTSYYHVLQHTLSTFMPKAITRGAEALVSIKRLQDFLMFEECDLKPSTEENKLSALEVNGKGEYNLGFIQTVTPQINEAICISHATAKWSPELNDNTLNDVSLDIRTGELVGVVGCVGAGKTSLLQAILGELPLTKGNVSVSGKISYASQEPWLFAGSVRQNILFGAPYEKKRYRKVIEVCALWRDFKQLMFGDKTIVGERGVSLSGGQKARINLARAVYKQADIYLLDDPLSAVDTHVGKHLFEQCIMGFLKSKTCILVTHQLHNLDRVDKIALMQSGSILASGKYNELSSSAKDFSKILLSAVSNLPVVVEEIKTPRVRHLSHQSIASSMDGEEEEDQSFVSEECATGHVGASVFRGYFSAAGHKFQIGLMIFMCVLTQLLANGGDYWITHWVNLEEHSYPYIYLQYGNTTKNFALHKDRMYFLYTSREMCIYIFTAFIISTLVVTLLRSYIFFAICMRASMCLHNNMFYSLTRATMSFFHANPAGRIINRFSKDIGSVDEFLPATLLECIQKGLTLLGVVMVVSFVNHYVIFPTLIVFVLFYYLRSIYISTSRCVKRLEGVARSPVFSHLGASLHGLSTIRAFKAEKILTHEFDQHQDNHSSAWYLFLATSRAFGFWLDIVCLVYIAVVVLSFLFFDIHIYGGSVGLTITQILSLTGMLQFGMRQSAELENTMTSVERVLQYSNLESEPALENPDGALPLSWPQEGKIQFQNVSMRFGDHLPRVLKDVTFSVMPREKVGIIGRTGAGKSSLITALFRLHDINGCIYIDDIPTHNIGLHQLRSKISIIPQEPVLFSGTIRNNLDPFDEYPDDVLWNALEEVELKSIVTELSGGLEWKLAEGGSNFSVGQRQLLCLSRAIIRNNRILVLDEATANVDAQTDGLIQSTIRRKFADCTVLTIAHRLHTVMDSDKLIVLDGGVLVEMDHPYNLLLNKNGVLYGMVKEAGRKAAESLHSIAASNFKRSHHPDLETVAEIS